jgi:hypothetical protein
MLPDKEQVVSDVVVGLFRHPLVKKIIWLPCGPDEMIRLVMVLEEREDRTPMSWPVRQDGFSFDIFCLGESGVADVLKGDMVIEPHWDFSSQNTFNRPKISSLNYGKSDNPKKK